MNIFKKYQKQITSSLFATIIAFSPVCQAKKVKQKKSKKTNTASFFSSKSLKDMTFEELKTRKESYVASKNYETALKYADQMITVAPDAAQRCVCEFDRAEILRHGGELTKAVEAYGEFVQTYPGDAQAEFASYQQISCSFNLTLDSERDQSQTKHTVELANNFLNRESYKEHRAQVEAIKESCLEKLFESEMNIVHYHLKMNDLLAADQRIRCIKEEFGQKMPTLEFQTMNLELELAQLAKNTEKVTEITALIKEKYPTGSMVVASLSTPKISQMNRF